MSLGSQHLLLVLYNVQPENKMLFRFTCWIEYFIVELFIEDTQYLPLSTCVEYVLNPNSIIEIAPEL